MKKMLIRTVLAVILGVLLFISTFLPRNEANQHFEIPKDAPTYQK